MADSNSLSQTKNKLDGSALNRYLSNGDLDSAVQFAENFAFNSFNKTRPS